MIVGFALFITSVTSSAVLLWREERRQDER